MPDSPHCTQQLPWEMSDPKDFPFGGAFIGLRLKQEDGGERDPERSTWSQDLVALTGSRT